MGRTIRNVVILVVSAGLVAAAVGVIVLKPWRYRKPDINNVGGTILVFELQRPASAEERERILQVLDRRLSLRRQFRHVTISADGDQRVEFRVPRQDQHEDTVKQLRDLAAHSGRLEFRIAANVTDDEEFVLACRRLFAEGHDKPEFVRELENRARQGNPPPLPTPPEGRKDWETSRKELGMATYAWVEMSPFALAEMHLDRADPEDTYFADDRKAVADAREKMDVAVLPRTRQLIFSRVAKSHGLEGNGERIEHFLLIRNSETAPGSDEKLSVGGEDVEHVIALPDSESGKWEISFRLTAAAGERFYQMTNANRPSQEFFRHLAIILDQQVHGAPRLQSGIREHGRITGDFTEARAETIANVIKAGALPVPFKPRPVAELVVPPPK